MNAPATELQLQSARRLCFGHVLADVHYGCKNLGLLKRVVEGVVRVWPGCAEGGIDPAFS